MKVSGSDRCYQENWIRVILPTGWQFSEEQNSEAVKIMNFRYGI